VVECETVEIVISDDGPGIAPDVLKRIGRALSVRRRAPTTRRANTAGRLACHRANAAGRTGAKVRSPTGHFPIMRGGPDRVPGPFETVENTEESSLRPAPEVAVTLGGLGSDVRHAI